MSTTALATAARPPLVAVSALPSDRQIRDVKNLVHEARSWLRSNQLITRQQIRSPLYDLTPAHHRALVDWETEYEWYSVAREAGVPRRHWPAHFDRGLETPALVAVRRFLGFDVEDDDAPDEVPAEYPLTLALCGPSGVGKTFAMVAGMRTVCLADPLIFWTMPALVRALLDGDRRRDAMAAAIGAELLVIDDVGATYVKSGGMADSLIEEILLEREARAEGEMMFSTNLTARQLYSELGDRVADRLRGPWGQVVELPGASLRAKGAR